MTLLNLQNTQYPVNIQALATNVMSVKLRQPRGSAVSSILFLVMVNDIGRLSDRLFICRWHDH